jgi:hypothetical protein
MAVPPFLESTDLSPPEAAPAKGNANKPAARSNEREIEIIAVCAETRRKKFDRRTSRYISVDQKTSVAQCPQNLLSRPAITGHLKSVQPVHFVHPYGPYMSRA